MNEEQPIKQSDEKIEQEKAGFLQKAKTFAESVVSKGVTGNKADKAEKELRVLSCHGDSNRKLPPCSERMNSKKFEGSHYCGACGCGDKEMTQLDTRKLESGEDSYSKLDFPKVHCPLKMPGFTNYVATETGISDNPRKKFIELTFGRDYVKENSK
jgi:hypothetical protein